MKGTELRDLLGRLEDADAPEPSAAFVAKLEADLRTMDRTLDTDAPRSRRRRLLVAAAPVAAFTAAAAAAAATLLPSDPHPREVRTADPGVTVPAPPPERPQTSAPQPTTVTAPPWLPPAAAPPVVAPTTTVVAETKVTTPAAAPAPGPAPTVAPPHEHVTTTVPRATTTTVAPQESLSLHCTPGVAAGNPSVSCGWSQSASPSFRWYRLWREAQGSSLTIVFQSDNRSTVSYSDQAVQSGTNYYYKVDEIDAAGNVIGSSNIVTLSCC